MAKKNEICTGVTQEMVDAWMDKYGEDNVYFAEVPLDERYDEYIGGIVRNPPNPLLNEYLRKAERVPMDAAKMLIRTIWLGGDERIKTERRYMMAYMDVLSEKLVGGQGRLKKLSRSTRPSQK